MSDEKKPSSVPVIPTPPPRARPGPGRRRDGGARGAVWTVALIIGVTAGITTHRYLEPVTDLVDYWVALALG